MTRISGVVLCVAYILGLLSTAVAWGGYGILALSIGLATFCYLRSQKNCGEKLFTSLQLIKPRLWLVAGLVGFLATLYFHMRLPQPEANDVSKFIAVADHQTRVQVGTVQGTLASTPRLTRNQRSQFWLIATKLNLKDGSAMVSKDVTGKLYVTVPLLQATGLHEGQAIAVTGTLYKPKPANNPGAFNFPAYLAQEGSFAGLKGHEVNLLDIDQRSTWGWWAVRHRIIRSQVRWLGVPEGPLVSAMVLGNRVVDVPFSVSDAFIQVGLAHALAASGFQVSLILGVVLTLTRRFSRRIQFSVGFVALLTFMGLTGPQPSVLRAVFMGIGALTALVMQRKVKPLGLLLLAGTLLLLLNPTWIWNLGFQFSFLATVGLVVTVPAIMKRLEWLPPAFATLIAVPIAAYVWTLPLQLYTFGLVSLYSIVVNVITTIPLSIISIGAFMSAIAALILPVAGSALAWLLYYPTYVLITIVEFFGQLPGVRIAVGTISALQLIALYALIALVWFHNWWQKRWWIAGLMAIGLVVIPVWQTQATIFRVTVLAAGTKPIAVIQDQGKVLLVNSGDENTARFTVLPFLQQQGVNQIKWAIATNAQDNSDGGWLEILSNLPIKNFYEYSNGRQNLIIQNAIQTHRSKYQTLSAEQMVITGSTTIQLINTSTPTLQLQIKDKTWLMLGKAELNQQQELISNKQLFRTQVLLWSGEPLSRDLVEAIKPEVAIATSATIDANTRILLHQSKTQLFLTGKDGAIRWTPKGNFEKTIEAIASSAPTL